MFWIIEYPKRCECGEKVGKKFADKICFQGRRGNIDIRHFVNVSPWERQLKCV